MIERMRDISILYVEDEEEIRKDIHILLKRRFDHILMAENGASGLDIYRNNIPDIIITDINMPIMDGLEMSRAILKINDKAAIIVTSAYNEAKYLLSAIELGVSNYLLKPLDLKKLDASLLDCVESVRKARTLSEREVSITEAYQRINSLIDFNEQNVNNLICLDTEVEHQLDGMIESFLGRGRSTALYTPANLIMTLTHGLAGQPQWLWYELNADGTLQKAGYLNPPLLDMNISAGNNSLIYFNDGESLPDDLILRNFLVQFARKGEKLRNLIWYRNDTRIVCALNYPVPVAACYGVLVKNLAMQTRYMDMISTQRHQTEDAFLYTINSLARAAEANDEDTGNHILRVGEYCGVISRRIGYSEIMANIMGQQSQLHDVGKIHISADILKKPGRLTAQEMALIREHTIFGANIIGSHPRLEIAHTIALQHHERWDGSGYPFGLRGTAIPMDARIAGLADIYDALRTRRSYKQAFDHETAFRIIVEGDGRTEPSHFDPDVLKVFKKVGSELNEVCERLTTVE